MQWSKELQAWVKVPNFVVKNRYIIPKCSEKKESIWVMEVDMKAFDLYNEAYVIQIQIRDREVDSVSQLMVPLQSPQGILNFNFGTIFSAIKTK